MVKVALILDSEGAEKLLALSHSMPVWVIDSDANRAAVAEARGDRPHVVTVLFTRSGESIADTCARALLSIEDHHSFDEVQVYGASASNIRPEVVRGLRLTEVLSTSDGCLLLRSAIT